MKSLNGIPALIALCATILLAGAASAQNADRPAPQAERGLPAEVVTKHRVGPLQFQARAGAVRLNDGNSGAALADLSYMSFELEGADPANRPVVFAINGGPGAGSAWLGLGALAPWRIRMDKGALSPSAPPRFLDNDETWLPFADIVLVDPPGTGFSKVLTSNEDVKKRFFSVQGDAESLAVFVRKWLAQHDRLASPKYLVVESYGGIRGPRLVQALSQRENIGVRGLVLVSPALEIRTVDGGGLMPAVGRLPTFAAVARKARDRAALKDAEDYAASNYILDLLKGPRDDAAQTRVMERVTALTKLDPSLVRRYGAQIGLIEYVRDADRAEGKIKSVYDGLIAGPDPAPTAMQEDWDDPMLDALRAPFGEAMTLLATQKLKWPVGDIRYETLSENVARQWDWGKGGRNAAEGFNALRRDLALDPDFKIAAVHGLYDLVTPYFASKLLFDQLPASLFDGRVTLVAAPGGHMVYATDEGRIALRDAGRAMIAR